MILAMLATPIATFTCSTAVWWKRPPRTLKSPRLAITFQIALALHLCAQPPAFEVASIKLNPISGARVFRPVPEPGKPLFAVNGNRVLDEFSTVRELIMDVYNVKDYQIIGLPDW